MSEKSFKTDLYHSYLSKLGYGSFDELKKRFEADKAHFEVEVLPLFPSNKKAEILELASGAGALLSLLSDKGYSNIRGVDIGEEQIGIAKKLGVEQIEKEDAMAALTATQSLDVVVALDLIEHFDKAQAVELIKKAYASLSSGGKLILRCPNADNVGGRYFLSADLTHELSLNSSSLAQLLRAGGFRSISIKPSYINTKNFGKELIRKPLYFLLKLKNKIHFFANGLSSKNLILSPNLIAVAEKN